MKARWNILHAGTLALVALLALQILWHGWLLPPSAAQRWPTLALAVLPLIPGVWIARHNLRRGVLVGGIVCLFYFCHGVSAAYSDASARWLAGLEIFLSLVVIAALGWDARHYKRPRK
ncbi:MAG TPA: DUF2069 domain-containing protein [Rudaea sp.]|nr:DUF2069 domain-containing protein [Pseudomonadota bacterium]HMM57191.1 DUF2069 domain-containing protein [Rudaea sp.]